MDLEGFAKRCLSRGDEDVPERLAGMILEVKGARISREYAGELAKAVVEEARATLDPKGEVFDLSEAGVTMGEFGVGSRGSGDFYAHEKIAEVIGETGAVVDSRQLDDSGAVEAGGKYIVLTVDGMHSRLSDYPFLAGFHVTRATLRDILVMRARPVAMFSDIHLADDGDVSRLFDHLAGIAAVGEVVGVPLITGSTLRIGGDMVIGNRLTGCVGAVGVSDRLSPRKNAAPGDVILMTEGAGGGTVCAAALYYGHHEVVEETINVKFLEAASALLDADVEIHAMTDVTNGGIRGDAKEISKTAGVKLVFEEEMMRGLVNRRVLEMLEALEIDYLGVSIDALLIIAPPSSAEELMKVVRGTGVDIDMIGRVEEGCGIELHTRDGIKDFEPQFRESAYTPIKKVVDEGPVRDFAEMSEKVDIAAERAIDKKRRFVERIRAQGGGASGGS
ncbi:AIR synthase-related protein [Methanotrichaceae archaeon M04Ac]|uniref:AIR synthase-related protein n=1 Tax=Candidatus Methanocrinis alkalitolerans TaxID=3033395 RepID=A0ABT5XCY6_9EURY|nr:AIR synthase-related protein [Candidatus Methanocrinis alkalitolerans]MCR3884127.1 AIR synthase-related protein [Methanothrix sp.]MDF0592580.1 AIR synthase-related protein [Candidatus Methanocrinis alkalitolerans]